MSQFEEVFKKLSTLNQKISDTEDRIKNFGESDALKGALEASKKELEKTIKKDAKELKERILDLETKDKKSSDFESTLYGQLKAEKEFFKDKLSGPRTPFEFETKAVPANTMTTEGSTTGQVVVPDFINRIASTPREALSLEALFKSLPTTSDVVKMPQEDLANSTYNVASQAGQGELKPESEIAFKQKSFNVETISTVLRVSDQFLEDFDLLAAFLQAMMPREMRLEVNRQILNGAGPTQNELEGLMTTVPTVDFEGILDIPGITDNGDINPRDRLYFAMQKLTADKRQTFEPNFSLITPSTMTIMALTKDKEGRYINPDIINGASSLVRGVSPRQINSFDTSTIDNPFLVGDTSQSMIFNKGGLRMKFFDQDRDNVPRNLVTIRVERRMAFGPTFLSAYLQGNMDFVIEPPAQGT